MVTLKKTYTDTVKPAMKTSRGYANPMQVPKVDKIVVNMATNTSTDKDSFKTMTDELALITGQRPMITKARVSISNFKLREGMDLGAKVTLRGARMYEFLERFIHVALPRIRDFRGVSPKKFDGRGNYNIGLSEQTVFPEIDPDKVKRAQGMNITIITTAKTDDEARELLKLLGMPFSEA